MFQQLCPSLVRHQIEAREDTLMRVATLLIATALAIIATGCVSVAAPDTLSRTERELSADLARLAPTVSPAEAVMVSARTITTLQELPERYRLVRPPILHNLLVNLGLRDRGLCHHFASDMQSQLQSIPLQTLSVRWAVARAGTWREHNAVVITARDAPFEAGIVLDAWRHSGDLYWGPVATDRYPWKEGFLTEPEAEP